MRKTWLALVSSALLAWAGCDNPGGGGGETGGVGKSPKASGDSKDGNATIETSKKVSPASAPAPKPEPKPGVRSGVGEPRDG